MRGTGRVGGELSFTALRGPRQILFGDGQRAAAGWVTAGLGSTALVCADPYLADTAELRDLLDALRAEGVTTVVHTDVVPELPTGSIDEAVRRARAAGVDVVVAVGGGSSMDLAKLVALLLAHGGDVADFYGENRVPGATVPVVALPTTAGTGSEVTPVAVLTDVERGSKVGISSPHLIPVAAICDPELSHSCPPAVTASAGADALSHCVEAYTAVRREPSADLARTRVFVGRSALTDACAVTGLRHIAAGLHAAWSRPDDREARASVMYGALMAGLAFGTAGTAAAHALQYPVGALTKTPHGVGVGLLLPYVMEHNRPLREAELAVVTRVLRAAGDDAADDAAADGSDRTSANGAVTHDDEPDAGLAAAAPGLVADLLASVGIPRDLASLGMPEDRLDWAAAQGPRSVRLAENNPSPLTEDDARRILRAAWAGDLSLASAPAPVGEVR